jgi:ribosomal protein S18 acetylase RimI-like enzyme
LNNVEIKTIPPDRIQDDVLHVYRQCEDFLALGMQPRASLGMVTKDIEEADSQGGFFQGIYSYGRMIGVVSYIPGGFEGKAEEAFLLLLMIIPAYRRKGAGREIVLLIEKEILKNSQIKTICTGVQVNNPEAVRFWKNNGYNIVGGPDLMPDSTTVFRLRKDIKR